MNALMPKPHPMGQGAVTQPQAQPQTQTQQPSPPPGALPNEVADNKPAMLSEGELVVPADEVRWHGLKTFMKMKQEAKNGLMQMAHNGQIQTTTSAAQHPAQQSQQPQPAQQAQPALNRGGYMSINPGDPGMIDAARGAYVDVNGGVDQQIPMFAGGGLMGTNIPAPSGQAPSDPGLSEYNAYLQTGGKSAPQITPFIDSSGSFNFGYANPGGGVDAAAGGVGAASPMPVTGAAQPQGLMTDPYSADTSKAAGTPGGVPTSSGNGAAASASTTNPAQGSGANGTAGASPSTEAGLMLAASQPQTAGGTTNGQTGSGGLFGNMTPGQMTSDAIKLGKGVYNQITDPNSTLNSAWNSIFGSSDINAPGAGIPGATEATASVYDPATNSMTDPSLFGAGVDPVSATAADVGGTAADAGAGFGAGVDPVSATAADVGSSAAADSSAGALSDVASSAGAGLMTAGAGFVGSELGHLIEPNGNQTNSSIGAGIGAAAGGAISGTVLGAELGMWAGPIGAAAGALIGTVLGGMIGPPPSVGPNGGADVHLDPKTGQFTQYGIGTDNGGDQSVVSKLSQSYSGSMNSILQALGGKLNANGPLPDFTVGYFKGHYFATDRAHDGPDGYQASQNTFSTPDQAVISAVKRSVGQMQVSGGNPYVMAALQNSKAKTVSDLQSDVQFAQAYQQLAQNRANMGSGLMSMQQSDPNSPLLEEMGAANSSVQARAQALGLTKLS